MDADALGPAVRNVAIAVLVAQHFPGAGARHEARLALAGYLHRAAVPADEVRAIGQAVETIVDGDLQDWSLV